MEAGRRFVVADEFFTLQKSEIFRAHAGPAAKRGAVLLAAGSGGGVTGLRTTVAMTSVEAKGAFAAASDLAPSFKSAGGT